MKLYISLVVIISFGYIGISNGGTPSSSVEWDALKVKWSTLPVALIMIKDKLHNMPINATDNSRLNGIWKLLENIAPKFKTMPRTVTETEKPLLGIFPAKWRKVDENCDNTIFLGHRYVYKNDWASVLLMDPNGYIVGIQTSVNDKGFVPYPPMQNTYYQHIGNNWTQTVYFVNPSTICSGTRGDPTLVGTGTGLWIQKGLDPRVDLQEIPRDEADVKKMPWGSGQCFHTMGQHYWYNVTEDMSCQNIVPYCLLYNKGKLTGFCFIKNTLASQSKNYDTPTITPEIFKMFLATIPDCLDKDQSWQKFRTIHVYFRNDAESESNC